jgi:DNA processing protein
MGNDLLYRMALIRVPGIGAFHAKTLINRFGDARSIFRAGPGSLSTIWGIGDGRVRAITAFSAFDAVEKELAFLEKYRIRPLFFDDPDYPRRLAKTKRSPFLLFYKGTADLNAGRILSVVGTRSPTEYGLRLTDSLIAGLAIPDLVIASGLAYGIDATAHKAALRHHLPTIGILGHGLDQIYPQEHAGLARSMVKAGGLLTQFSIGTKPDQHTFPLRNHIIAAICDALLVIETGARGGSMVTVTEAIGCKKEIFAIPGRVNDKKSIGCNELILQGKATLLTGAEQLLQALQWTEPAASQASPAPPPSRSLPELPFRRSERSNHSDGSNHSGRPNHSRSSRQSRVPLVPSPPSPINESLLAALSEKERTLLDLLCSSRGLNLDQLLTMEGPGGREVSLTLLSLELQNLIRRMPGQRYVPIHLPT